jgi:hypothetical protein
VNSTIRMALLANILFWNYLIVLPVGSLSLNVIATLMAGFSVSGRPRRRVGACYLIVLAVVAYGAFVFLLGPRVHDLLRVLFSVCLFSLTSFAVKRLVERVDLAKPLLRLNELRLIVVLVALDGGVRLALSALTNRPIAVIGYSTLYNEPSFVAFSLCPVVVYLLFTSRPGARVSPLLMSLALFLCFTSATFVLFFLLMLLMAYVASVRNSRQFVTLILRLALLATALGLFLATPLSERTRIRFFDVITFSSESNISSVVFVNGWLYLDAYLTESHGLGIGFNAMGLEPIADTPGNRYLELLGVPLINSLDGSFLLSKLGSELGVVGILVWFTFLADTWRSLRPGCHRKESVAPVNKIFLFCFLSEVSLAGLVRSAGYFTGPSLLALFSMMLFCSKPSRTP